MDIRTAIRELSKNDNKMIIPAIVDKVDNDRRTVDCTPLNDEAPLLGINLQACQGGKHGGVLLVPRKGSHVVVALYDTSGRGCVILTEEIERILVEINDTIVDITSKGVIKFKVKDTIIELTSSGITINGGDNHGMVKVKALTERLNAIEDDINSLKNVFSSWIPGSSDGGAALKAAVATWISNQLSKTSQKDLENDKVKH